MRQNNNNASGLFVLIPIVFVCGVLAVIAATRAEMFKPQPSQAVVSAAYATRAKIENDAARESLAADLAHTKNIQRTSEQLIQTARDLLIVAGGVGTLAFLAIVGTHAHHKFSTTRAHVRILNPAQLPPELQLEAIAWLQRADIARSLSQTKTFAITANHERGLLRSTAMPAAPATNRLPPPIVIGDTPAIVGHDDDTGIHMHDDPAMTATQPARAVVNTSRGDMPSDIATEEDFNDYINRGR
jgi:hypothetical protein